MRWWGWAWHTPQAAAWAGSGFEAFVARRARMEDVLEAGVTAPLLGVADRMDRELGLTPKAFQELRWHLDAGAEPPVEVFDEVESRRRERLSRLAEA